jgi:hypothetical protein
MKDSPLNQLRDGKLPEMVRWYDPRLLARVGVRTLVSSVFGQYADQRLTQAATDPAEDHDLRRRYDYRDPTPDDPMRKVALDDTGAYWIDYLADTGDGFDSTYAMAYLLAKDYLTVEGAGNLTHGDILIMGGDQCYPQATREEYKKRLLTPFQWAFDVPTPQRKLFAIPGNHDWYDGLAAFDSLFCSSRDKLSAHHGTAIGGWQCQQHRSYWAIRLPYNWWIWGTDIQFSKYLDSPQINYFRLMASEMKPGDKLIICMAEPSWMLADFQGQDEEENFFKITAIARDAGAKIAAIIAGDWHHYNRYYSPEHDVHLLTAGGGGSFLHPTHVLKDSISIQWPEPVGASHEAQHAPPAPGADPQFRKQNVEVRLNKTGRADVVREVGQAVGDVVEDAVEDVLSPAGANVRARRKKPRITRPQAPKCYPEKYRSILMSLRNVFFPFMNVYFAIGIGLIYWLITWEFYSVVERHDISAGKIDAVGVHTEYFEVFQFLPLYVVQATLVSIPLAFMLMGLFGVLVWYVDAVETPGVRRFMTKAIVGSAHFLAHVVTMFALGFLFVMVNNWVAPRLEPLVNQAWQGQGSQTSAVGKAVRETLEPLSEARKAQRDMFGGEGDSRTRRAAPPAAAMPDGPASGAPSAQNNLLSKAVRQVTGFVLYPFQIIILGGLVGGFVWGLYWVITSALFRMHAEDAFAALRIKHYKNMLRFKFEPDKLTIYPIGIDRIPPRRFWTSREGAPSVPEHNPALIGKRDMRVRLIETPIVIRDETEV